MLEVTSASVEEELGLDFASIYRESTQYRWVCILLPLPEMHTLSEGIPWD